MNKIERIGEVVNIEVLEGLILENENIKERIEVIAYALIELQELYESGFDEANQLWMDCLIQKTLEIAVDPATAGGNQ